MDVTLVSSENYDQRIVSHVVHVRRERRDIRHVNPASGDDLKFYNRLEFCVRIRMFGVIHVNCIQYCAEGAKAEGSLDNQGQLGGKSWTSTTSALNWNTVYMITHAVAHMTCFVGTLGTVLRQLMGHDYTLYRRDRFQVAPACQRPNIGELNTEVVDI